MHEFFALWFFFNYHILDENCKLDSINDVEVYITIEKMENAIVINLREYIFGF